MNDTSSGLFDGVDIVFQSGFVVLQVQPAAYPIDSVFGGAKCLTIHVQYTFPRR
jgi:hypothetical protein